MKINNKNADEVAAENQKKTQAQSLFSPQSDMLIPTVVQRILNESSDVSTTLSSNEVSGGSKFAENMLQPTPVLSFYIGNATRTNLVYKIATSFQYETIVRTRTYTYIIDRVHDDYHHYVESSTLVRKETQYQSHQILLTHTLNHVLKQKVVAPSTMP